MFFPGILDLGLRNSEASLSVGAGATGVKERGIRCQFSPQRSQHTGKKWRLESVGV